jgi:hypothetical protein
LRREDLGSLKFEIERMLSITFHYILYY